MVMERMDPLGETSNYYHGSESQEKISPPFWIFLLEKEYTLIKIVVRNEGMSG